MLLKAQNIGDFSPYYYLSCMIYSELNDIYSGIFIKLIVFKIFRPKNTENGNGQKVKEKVKKKTFLKSPS